MSTLIKISNLKIHYPIRGGFFNRVLDYVRAVDDVTFEIEAGKTYGLIGESGSGKSTIGKAIVGLETITAGEIQYEGVSVTNPRIRRSLNYNKDVQMIFQDSMSSLNPRKTIYDIIAEPLRNFTTLKGESLTKRVEELLAIVGLPAQTMYQYPFQFSGGQRQRIVIARAVATNPKLIVADEPVSALDLSVQAQVLNFMKKIQKEYGIAFLFISHDLGVVRHMTEKIAIIHAGRFVEIGTRDDIFNRPQHIYTQRLLAAIPEIDIAHREENRVKRQAIETAFNEQWSDYYDKNGRAFDLQAVSKTHAVALKTQSVKRED
ncbi:ATP-binding cassette domain-containing protein [Weissella diestrammenae]|uniref:ATP-binding cassette domain-containing protein n=1 Tax=Weissella diestrammenae TaxID=1162633 RepID=UPI001960D8D4|nr:ATP-binding cassette domain-containing protein [Weissella diestrammenae]MCM0582695.1 ABC transporter ATP-binding protein [Weissella diestrammenae]